MKTRVLASSFSLERNLELCQFNVKSSGGLGGGGVGEGEVREKTQLHTYLWLPEDSVNSQNMVENFIEQHQWYIQLFFIKYLLKKCSKRSIVIKWREKNNIPGLWIWWRTCTQKLSLIHWITTFICYTWLDSVNIVLFLMKYEAHTYLLIYSLLSARFADLWY